MRMDGECEARKQIANDLGKELELATRIWQTWYDFDKRGSQEHAGIIVAAIAGLQMKLTRQYRSIIELCERAEGSDAMVLTRSMFEAMLAVFFILNPDLKIELRRGRKRKHHACPSASEDHSLSRELRAKLYFAHENLMPHKIAKNSQRYDVHRQAGLELEGRIMPMDEIGDAIGPKWVEALQASGTYSGLSVKALAVAINKEFAAWYDVIYVLWCHPTHSGDGFQYVDFDGDSPALVPFSTSREVSAVLQYSTLMFLAAWESISETLGFGAECDAAREAFADERKEMETFWER